MCEKGVRVRCVCVRRGACVREVRVRRSYT